MLAAASCLDQVAIVSTARTWSWREVHAAAIDLAPALSEASAACNLCVSRVGFLVTWLAALRSGVPMLLPPSGGSVDLARILRATPRPMIVADDARMISAGWRELAPCHLWTGSVARAPASDSALTWQPDWHRPAVVLHTSGTTGAPQPQIKTLAQLCAGARALGARLSQLIGGGSARIERIVCSVPPQHMFGFEVSVMLPLTRSLPLLEGRPLLPADVQQAFADTPPAVWIATPLHLHSLVQAGVSLPHCVAVIASTMPLAQSLARSAEERVHAPVLEIYGSTETGVLVMRRVARDADLLPVDGVRLVPVADGTLAFGGHFKSPARLPDHVEFTARGRFALLGRDSDLLKIGGRRASLSGLNLLLQEMPGLDDGVFYLPNNGNPVQRLCLIHSGSALDRGAVEGWLRSRIDPAFLPRTLIRVAKLPRDDNGKLPRAALDELFAAWQREHAHLDASDRPPCLQVAGTAPLRFAFVIPGDHRALAGHFPGRAVVPGVLLLQRVLEQVADWLQRPLERIEQVKFAAPLLPQQTAEVVCEHDGTRVRFSVRRPGLEEESTLASGTLLMAPAGSVAARPRQALEEPA